MSCVIGGTNAKADAKAEPHIVNSHSKGNAKRHTDTHAGASIYFVFFRFQFLSIVILMSSINYLFKSRDDEIFNHSRCRHTGVEIIGSYNHRKV